MYFFHYILAWFEKRRVAKMSVRERLLEDLNKLFDRGYTYALVTAGGENYIIDKTPQYDDVYMGGMGEFQATARGNWHTVPLASLVIEGEISFNYVGLDKDLYDHQYPKIDGTIYKWHKQSQTYRDRAETQVKVLQDWYNRMQKWNVRSGVPIWKNVLGEEFYLTLGSFRGVKPELDGELCLMSKANLLEVKVKDLVYLWNVASVPKCSRFSQFVPVDYLAATPCNIDDDRYVIIDTHVGRPETAAYVVVNDESPEGVKSLSQLRIRINMDEYMRDGSHLELAGFAKKLTESLKEDGHSVRGTLYLRNIAIMTGREVKVIIYNMEQWSKLSQDKKIYFSGTDQSQHTYNDFVVAFDTTGINFTSTAY
jgi:hypothetical protein